MQPPDQKLALVEVFRSPQGEGYNAGRDAVFVRFAGCNLSCVFAEGAVCDTPYQHAAIKTTVSELFAAIIPVFVLHLPHPATKQQPSMDDRTMLILTGGEPTLAPAFDAVVRRGVELGFYVAVETNGTRWREGLRDVHWVCVSPKFAVKQGSTAPFHNHNPQSPALSPQVVEWLQYQSGIAGEYRYVIGPGGELPPFFPAFRHYLSPATKSDGTGKEWQSGFPGFVDGAVDRCLTLITQDPRWRISLQTHKLLGVR